MTFIPRLKFVTAYDSFFLEILCYDLIYIINVQLKKYMFLRRKQLFKTNCDAINNFNQNQL